MRIEYLKDNRKAIPVLASWLYTQWGHLSPGASLEGTISRLESHTGSNRIPTSFVALSGDALLGTASLVYRDLDIRKDLSPWLASVFVAPEHRRQGVASALVVRVIEEARKLGIRNFYLFTPDQENLYARLGWQVLHRARWRDMNIVIMEYDLTV